MSAAADGLLLTVAWFETAMPDGPAYGDPETTTWGNFASIFSGSRREGNKDGQGLTRDEVCRVAFWVCREAPTRRAA
jgi:hypothetical protein